MKDSPLPAPRPRPTIPWATAFIALLALGVQCIPDAARSLLYERELVRAGEFWRLWTGHLVHFGASHLLWNLAVLIPAGVWAERLAPARARLLLLLGPGFIGGLLFALDPALQRYGGLSALAAAALAFLAITQLAQGTLDRWFWRGVLLLLALKISAELVAERPVFARLVEPGAHAVPLAHLAGVMAAFAAHFTHRRRRSATR